jgi:hypothetical protein
MMIASVMAGCAPRFPQQNSSALFLELTCSMEKSLAMQ